MPRIGRAYRVEDPNAAAILEMQGARIKYPRIAGEVPVAILPEELAMDKYFMEHTFPYIAPGPEVVSARRTIRKPPKVMRGEHAFLMDDGH